jgi:hypothetical protein
MTPTAAASPPTRDLARIAATASATAQHVVSSPASVCTDGPALGKWRYGLAAARLHDGRVLVAGGEQNDGGPPLPTVEIYSKGEFSPGPAMKEGRAFHRLVAIDGGKRVLAVGGHAKAVELFDAEKNTWTTVGRLKDDVVAPLAVPITYGKHVFIAGGDFMYKGALSTNSYLFEVSTQTFSFYKTLAAPSDGIAGGFFGKDETEILFARTGSGAILPPLALDAKQAALVPIAEPSPALAHATKGAWVPNDVLLIDFREATRASAHGLVVRVVVTKREVYNDLNGAFERVVPLLRDHDSGAAVLLDATNVLVVGGLNATSARAEICPAG